MSVAKALATELSEEAVGTRKVLERVPTDNFSWQPHEKSMTFGKLASHIAYTPGWVATIVGMDELVTDADSAPPPGAGSTEELLKTFDDKVKEALLILENATDNTLAAKWRMKSGGRRHASGRDGAEVCLEPHNSSPRTVDGISA